MISFGFLLSACWTLRCDQSGRRSRAVRAAVKLMRKRWPCMAVAYPTESDGVGRARRPPPPKLIHKEITVINLASSMSVGNGLDVVERLLTDRPSFHLGGQAHWYSLPETLQAIRAAVRPGHSTIETGAGASTVVFAAAGANHTVISPDPEEHERIRDYCGEIGVETSAVTFIDGPSDDILPSHLGVSRSLDVAFIDGAHLFPFPEVDWHYISRALKVGGTLFMDDIPIPAVAPLFHHMAHEPNWRVDGVLDARAAAFTLLAEPECYEWLRQPFNRGYPDYGFLEVSKRVRLVARHRVAQLRKTASRYPMVRRAYERAMQFNDREI